MRKRILQKILSESSEVSKELEIIIEIGDSKYYENRAIELIKEAQLSIENHQFQNYHDRIRQAVTLLTLARIRRTNESIT